MLKGSKKWSLLGVTSALGISLAIFLTLPNSEKLNDLKVEGSEGDYSRTLYGVPVLEMEHYKIGEDKYLQYILEGRYSVGKSNPSSYPLWYSNYLNRMLAENNTDFLEYLQANADKQKIIYDAIAKGQSNETYATLNKMLEEYKKEKAKEEEEEAKRLEEEKAKEEAEGLTDKSETDEESDEDTESKDTETTDENAESLVTNLQSSANDFKTITSKSFDKEQWSSTKESIDKTLTNVSDTLAKNSEKIIEETSEDFVKSLSAIVTNMKSLVNKQDKAYSEEKDTSYTKELESIQKEITELKGKLK